MKLLKAGLFAALAVTCTANAEVITYSTPHNDPYVWTPRNNFIPPPQQNPPAKTFNPSFPPSQDGTDQSSLFQSFTSAASSTGHVTLAFGPLGGGTSAVSQDRIENLWVYIYPSGSESTIQQITLIRARHYAAGESVGPDGTYGSAAVGWGQGGGGYYSLRYKTYDPSSSPLQITEHSLPREMTIGIRFQIDGVTHYGWADVQLRDDNNRWNVSRWGYETEPNTPALVVPPPACTGDANGDGDANAADLSILLSQFGTSVAAGSGADFNSDGVVDAADLSIMLSWFGCD